MLPDHCLHVRVEPNAVALCPDCGALIDYCPLCSLNWGEDTYHVNPHQVEPPLRQRWRDFKAVVGLLLIRFVVAPALMLGMWWRAQRALRKGRKG